MGGGFKQPRNMGVSQAKASSNKAMGIGTGDKSKFKSLKGACSPRVKRDPSKGGRVTTPAKGGRRGSEPEMETPDDIFGGDEGEGKAGMLDALGEMGSAGPPVST